MERAELLSSPGYWTAELQLELYRQINDYMKKKGLNKVQLAHKLGCTKSYITQLLNGEFDHKLSKFFELSLAIGKVPEFNFVDLNDLIEYDEHGLSSCITLHSEEELPYHDNKKQDYSAA